MALKDELFSEKHLRWVLEREYPEYNLISFRDGKNCVYVDLGFALTLEFWIDKYGRLQITEREFYYKGAGNAET